MCDREMAKHVILVPGTPCVGKTSVARLLVSKLDAEYVNLTELAMSQELIIGKDEERNSSIIDEVKMKRKIGQIVKSSHRENIVIDGHYAASVVPKSLVTRVFVLRRDPVELRRFMRRSGFQGRKLRENLASEVLDVCLVDTLNVFNKRRVCELDITSKSVEATVEEVLSLLHNPSRCRVGVVDWLGKLEREGLLEEYVET
jgi:adenylate kinase